MFEEFLYPHLTTILILKQWKLKVKRFHDLGEEFKKKCLTLSQRHQMFGFEECDFATFDCKAQ